MSSFEQPHIKLESVSVDYGNHIGIEKVTLEIPRGEIFALVGDHGAGKSTITRVLCGAIRPDSGSIYVDGARYEYLTPQKAISLGIVAIHQDMMVVPALSAYENLFLNREKRKGLFSLDHVTMKKRMYEALRVLGADDLDIHKPIGEYRRDRQQLVELARIICFPSKIIIIDEISARLSPGILENIHHILSVLRKQGSTILYISHDMGEVVDFSSRIAVLRNGSLNRIVSAADVNELQLMQLTYSSMRRREDLAADNAALFYQKTFTENIIQRFPFAALIIDTQYRVRIANDMFCQLFSFPKSELEGIDFYNLTLFPTELREHVDRLITQQNRGTIDNVKLSAGNTEISVILHFFKLFDDESFLGTAFFLQLPGDHRLSAPDEEWRVNEETDVKRQLRHEINNALGTILNHIQIARTSDERNDITASIVIIEDEIRRIRRIVQENTVPAEVDSGLRRLVEKTCALVQTSVRDKEIRLTIDIDSQVLVPIPADRLQQVLLNLLFNSIDAVDHGGVISIQARRNEIGNQSFVEISIGDNGCGISASDLPFVFSPFFSTKKSDTTHGVGLALCRSIVEEYGGSIHCRSVEGSGTDMTIFIPRDSVPERV